MHLFFFHEPSFFPVDAFIYGNFSEGTEQKGVYCPKKLASGETWRTTNLNLIRTFEIINNTNKDIKVLTTDARQVVKLSSCSLTPFKNTNDSCEGTQSTENFFYRAMLIPCKINGGEAIACIGDSVNLDIDVYCSE